MKPIHKLLIGYFIVLGISIVRNMEYYQLTVIEVVVSPAILASISVAFGKLVFTRRTLYSLFISYIVLLITDFFGVIVYGLSTDWHYLQPGDVSYAVLFVVWLIQSIVFGISALIAVGARKFYKWLDIPNA